MDQSVVDLSLVFELNDLVLALLSLHMDLVLPRSNVGALVHIGVNFDIGIIAELQRVLSGGDRC